jgi:NADH-ubiquinone oxidoreductase chain 5
MYLVHLIIEASFGQYYFSGYFSYWLGTLTALFTSIYSLKILSLTFLGKPNGNINNYLYSHEPSLSMFLPLIILALASIIFGYYFKDLFIGFGSNFWGNSLFIHPNHINLIDTEFSLPTITKLLAVILSIIGSIISLILISSFNISIKSNLTFINLIFTTPLINTIKFLSNKYWFDNIYNNLLLYPVLYIGYLSNKVLDKGLIEFFGPTGFLLLFKYSKGEKSISNGLIPNYALFIILSLILILLISFFNIDIKLVVFFLIQIFKHLT